MVQIDYSLKEEFSWEDYCTTFSSPTEGWDALPHETSRQFMQKLGLSAIHPHCVSRNFTTDAPPMGPLVVHDYHEGSTLAALVTFWKQATPALLAMSELWLRLFAAVLAPLGIAYMVWALLGPTASDTSKKSGTTKTSTRIMITVASVLSLASSIVLATDMWYVYQYGSDYGVSLLVASSVLAGICAFRHRLVSVAICIVLVLSLTVQLAFDWETKSFQFGCEDELPLSVPEGMYYNDANPLVDAMVQHWPEETRTYTAATGATPWTPTGDARTGIPFLTNFWHDLTLTKVWVPTEDDEAVRLEMSFPTDGHQLDKPVYVILHGLSGGSQEEFIKDMVHRANADGSTVCIMIARGLMDTPIKGWNVFHGARVSDIATTALAIRPAVVNDQSMVGVGFSMGAIVLANYVARSGPDCALDAAIAVSGVLDSRPQGFNERAKRLWQPMLALTLRDQFVVGKVAERYRERLTKNQMLELMRATHISGVDQHAVVTYNGFDDLMHYYSEMSAMGDIPLDENPSHHGRIANVSIPLCMLSALDDPLITWKAVASNRGLRHPSNLVKTGSGNLMLLLTKAGGHVGWPLGVDPSDKKWGWMNGAVQNFVASFEVARKKL